MEITHDLTVIETALLLARHPRQVHDDVIMKLPCVISRIIFLRYLALLPLHHRASHLMHRAKVKCYNQCYVLTRRCAELVDACLNNHGGNHHESTGLPSYAGMAEAVNAADDALQYMATAVQDFYDQNVRPILVSFMADAEAMHSGSGSDCSGSASCSFVSANATSSDDCSVEDNDFASVFVHALPAAKRVRWATACTAFEYIRNASDAEAASSGSGSDCSGSASCSFVSANASFSDDCSDEDYDFAPVFVSALPTAKRVCGLS
jgi:hypothetical protein